MRNSGVYDFEELLSVVDGSNAYRFGAEQVDHAAAESRNTPDDGPEMTWTVEDDEDDLEFSITPTALASLVNRARAHCPGCPGTCGR